MKVTYQLFATVFFSFFASQTLAQKANVDGDAVLRKKNTIEAVCKEAIKFLPTSSIKKGKNKNSNEWILQFRKLIIEGTKASTMEKEKLLNYTFRINSFLNALDSAHNVSARMISNDARCDFCPRAQQLPSNAPCSAVCGAYRDCCLYEDGAYQYNTETGLCETESWPCTACVDCNFEQLVCYADCVTKRPPIEPIEDYLDPTNGFEIKVSERLKNLNSNSRQ